MADAGGARAVCEFCGGLKYNDQPTIQITIYGALHWLHVQCSRYYERAQEPTPTPL